MGLGSASGKVGMGLSVKWVEGTVLSFHGRFDPEEVKGFISESKELKEDENGITVSDMDSLLFVWQFKSFVHSWSQDRSLYSVLGMYSFKNRKQHLK